MIFQVGTLFKITVLVINTMLSLVQSSLFQIHLFRCIQLQWRYIKVECGECQGYGCNGKFSRHLHVHFVIVVEKKTEKDIINTSRTQS